MDFFCTADILGSGSTQATTDVSDAGNDDPFWTTLNANVKNLHAVISGHGKHLSLLFIPSLNAENILPLFHTHRTDHGNEWCVREPTQDVVFCFDKHSGCVHLSQYSILCITIIINITIRVIIQLWRLLRRRMGPRRAEHHRAVPRAEQHA